MHTGYIDFPRRSWVPTAEITIVPQNTKAAFLPFQTVFIVTAFCSPCPFADRLFGHNFPQREFIVCKTKFYSRAQKSRCKRFQKTLVSRYQVNTLLGCSPLKCHKSWDQDVLGSRRFPLIT